MSAPWATVTPGVDALDPPVNPTTCRVENDPDRTIGRHTMTNNMYDELAKGVEDAEARRNASIGSLWTPEAAQFLADVARAKAEGLKLSPTMTMAAGYAEIARDAAAKTGQV